MDKMMKNLPKQAQTIVQSLQAQLQKAGEQIQQMSMEIKCKSDIEQMKDAGQTRRTLITTTGKAHDTETKSKTDNDNSQRDYAGWVSEVDKNVSAKRDIAELDRQTKLDVAEIHVAGQLLNSHVEAEHNEKAADKAIKAGQTDRA
jgi:hypothetical protein